MSTVTYLYDVNQVVFYVSAGVNTPNGPNNTCGVQEAVVRSVQINIDNTGTTIQYTLVFTQQPSNTITTLEANVYPDVDSALAAYRIIVLG